jgi:hypothetical protein
MSAKTSPAVRSSALLGIAKDEISRWKEPVRETARVVLFAFVHRLKTGIPIEQAFTTKSTSNDYQI